VRFLACKRAIQVVYAAEVVAVFSRDDCKLVLGVSGVGIYLGSQIIVSLSRPPIALLVLVDEFGFTVAGEVAELDERLVAGDEDLSVEGCGDAVTRSRLGSWASVSERGAGGVRVLTVILPFLGNFAQLGYAVKLSVEVQYILAVEALARLDELEVCLLELSDFHDMVLGALELSAN
jgi:hypothetical protein